MFKHLFATMNDMLEEIIRVYPLASPGQKTELDEQLRVLRAMSDTCIEEWLLFEEKMGKLNPLDETDLESAFASAGDSKPPAVPQADAESFAKAQGYYKLYMFDQAVSELQPLASRRPDDLLVRVYLAMGLFRLGEYAEAYRHFQLLLPLTENPKLKAISYNAMGCIQVHRQNMEQAFEYFKMAYKSDPTCVDPVVPLGAGRNRR